MIDEMMSGESESEEVGSGGGADCRLCRFFLSGYLVVNLTE
jgi:hypothetical protein